MSEKIVNEFIKYFNKLNNNFKNGQESEEKLFKLHRKFHQETGGRLNHYNMPAVAAVCIVKVIKNINGFLKVVGFIGVKRGIEPEIGGFAFPGGYVDSFETPRQAASRELMEETGLVLDEKDFTFFHEQTTQSNHLLMFYTYNGYVFEEDIRASYEKLANKQESLEVLVIKNNTKMCFETHEAIKNNLFININKNNGLNYEIFEKHIEEIEILAKENDVSFWLCGKTNEAFPDEKEMDFNIIENPEYPCLIIVDLGENGTHSLLYELKENLENILNVDFSLLTPHKLMKYQKFFQCKIN